MSSILLRKVSNIFYMSLFSQRLKELRTDRGLSMKELAKEIEATDAAVCNWENGVNEPKLAYIIKLCVYFGVSADYLIGLSDS